ncbi:Ig-like domain-containing protein [Corynebacterium sp. CCM 9185]|uniref:Ig-like domain repeat protein n=1 Tax=Corynebacterium marambiense TaxID=2765364 RepID=A0ABS0VY74_9CORY|nr:Ig-like domain-containing protein [Corynebacterium marambiense]MBI9001718.1 Ig-like domain repeat protein [Corynebacterium marambiense]MCK7662182.1 Ig-like domain-containing protein [Corynebacterium marambiense]
MKTTTRTATAAGATLCLVLGITPSIAATADEKTPTTGATEVTYTCTFNGATFGNHRQDVSLSPESVTATYPEIVEPGGTFRITLQPGVWSTTEKVGRIRYDIALPTNGTVTGLALADDGENIAGTDAEVSVIRVNAEGMEDPAGGFARISAGNLTIDNGPNANDDNNPATGLSAEKGTTFRLPGVTITMTAPMDLGTVITTGLRNAGTTGETSTLSLLEVRPGFFSGYNNDAVACTADAAGTQLSSTTVSQINTTTAFTTTDPIEVPYNDPRVPEGTLRVNVARPDGTAIPRGQVRFTIGDQTRDVDVTDGVAELTDFSFPVPEGRDPIVHTVSAEYTGVDGVYRPSAAAQPITVTVTPKDLEEVRGTISLEAIPDYAHIVDDQLSVTLTAQVGAENGAALPEGLTVSFRDGDVDLSASDVVNGAAILTALVPNEKKEHSFTAILAEHTTDDVHVTGATASAQVTVVPVMFPTLVVEIEPTQAALGDTVTLRAHYHVDGGEPAGSEIVFRSNGIRIGTATTGEDGTAVLPHQLREPGDFTFTAFAPERTGSDERHYRSADSGAVHMSVESPVARISTTTLSRTAPPGGTTLTAGDEAEFTATVDTGGERIGGTVSFYAGDVLLGTAELDPAAKTATFRHTFTTPGETTVHAVFGGGQVRTGEITTATYAPSKSEPLALTVAPRDIVVPGPSGGDGDSGGSSLPGGSSTDGIGAALQRLFNTLGNTSFTDIFSRIISAIRAFFNGFGQS